ncbi:MAG TPA: hypothetical protein VK772_01465 [Puia sp.]|jgi:hypothetical protein|nr:hypothetical protein [Puia sp.]
MNKQLFFRLVISVSLFISCASYGQSTTYPSSMVDQSFTPVSPNAQGFESYNNDPVALYEGTPAISIPIYTLKCGSLNLPISLSYNYNGLLPAQDASWVGLGWNLNAGGVISRTVQGNVDGLGNSGFNYTQYNLHDTIFNSHNLDSFLQKAYNPNLAYGANSYDMALDLFDAEFNGYSGKFLWYNGKAYGVTYNKDLSINWPSPTSNFTITTTDGTLYTFTAKETTTNYYYGGIDSTSQSYTSAWYLTTIVSVDRKDTIQLNYATYSWQQAKISYQSTYTMSNGNQTDLGADPLSYFVNPSVATQVLQSIQCRNARVSFVPDGTMRTDVLGTSPRLREIDVIDSITGNTVKKNVLSYEYFEQTSYKAANHERLALKTFSSINPLLSSDSLTYIFKYINEYGLFSAKSSGAIDYWGYSNTIDTSGSQASILPTTSSPFYMPTPSKSFSSFNRTPSFTYCSYGALDTIVYPAGGYTAFQYEQNQFNNTFGIAAPGIRVASTTTVSNNPLSPQAIQRKYSYLMDDGATSSGVVSNLPVFIGNPFVLSNSSGTFNYTVYTAPTNSNGTGGSSTKFFYQKVSETISSGGETHKSDHYFTSYPEIDLDVRQTEQIDYINTPSTSVFTPVTKTVSAYNATYDTSFIYASAYIDTENVNSLHNPKNWYAYADNYNYEYLSYWVRPTYQQMTQYDLKGDSIVNTTYYTFNSTTRNLSSTSTGTSDGQSIIQKFKYPEDYSTSLTGNMITVGLLNPVLEKQTWLYKNSSDSVLISGVITVFDQSIYKPTSTYAIETTKPITSLNNETSSGGKFTSLLSDSRYILKGQIQYDGNNNLSVANKASDINVSYLWDYNHATPIAEVKNAAQADVAYTSFEADGKGSWTFTGASNADSTSPTGNNCYNLGQMSGSITKSGLTSGNNYIISYWLKRGTPLTITGTVAGYPLQGKTINGWTYFEHKITGQTSVTVNVTGTVYIDELRLYPYSAQMTTYTYNPLIGMSSQCDADNRISYFKYDPFGRLKVVLDQDHNIVKTVQYHYIGETNE